MSYKISPILAMITLLTLSCQQRSRSQSDCILENSSVSLINSPDAITLCESEARILRMDELCLYNPTALVFHDDSLLLVADEYDSKQLLIIDLKMNKCSRYIRKGRAENELLSLWDIHLSNNHIYLSSPPENKLLVLQFNKNSREFKANSSVKFPHQFMRCAPLNEQYITLASASSAKRFFVWDNHMSIVDTIGSFPSIGIENHENADNGVLQSDWAFSPDGTHFVSTYKRIDYIDIYKNKHLKRRIRGPRNHTVSIRTKEVKEGYFRSSLNPTYFSYKGVAATETGFWTGYIGLDCRNGMMPVPEMNKISKLFRFDWDGNVIESFVLSNPIDAFAIDEKSRKLYCLYQNPEPEILIYNLP